MIFPVSNYGIQWTLDFAADSVVIAVIDFVQNITISSQEKPLSAWQLLLSQRQDFLDSHLPRVPTTQNQEGTMEMRDAVFRPGIDTHFSPNTFDDFSMEVSVENPIMLDEEEDKEIASPPPSTPSLSDPRNLPGCREVALLGQERKMYPILFLEICFNRYYRVCVLV